MFMKFLKQRKGQAFETMMLVISVIVALAILGVLLGILGNLPGVGTGDPKLVVKEELKKIAGTYSSGTQPREATLKTGVINTRDITDGTTLLPDSVKFIVADSLKDGVIELGESDRSLRATRDLKVTVVVCGDPAAAGGEAQYFVSIAPERQGLLASDNCVRALPSS